MTIVFLVITSCNSYEYVVESDYSYTGKFDKYRTFGFGTNQTFSGLEKDKEILEKSVKNILNAWGYRYNERKPDLLIVYSIFFDDVNIKGFSQPQFEDWLRQNFINAKALLSKDSIDDYTKSRNQNSLQAIEGYRKVDYELKEGTIFLSFFDRKRDHTVWQGYASGVFGNNSQKNERVMRSAVIQILDEYKLLAIKPRS